MGNLQCKLSRFGSNTTPEKDDSYYLLGTISKCVFGVGDGVLTLLSIIFHVFSVIFDKCC